MDSHQIFSCGITGVDASRGYSHNTTSNSHCIIGPMNFDLGSSPESPLFTNFDSDTLTSLSTRQEQYSFKNNHLSKINPSYNSLLEIRNSFHQISPFSTQFQESLQFYSSRGRGLQDAAYDQSIKLALQELESDLMGSDTDNNKAVAYRSVSDENKHLELRSCRSRTSIHEPLQGSNVIQNQLCSTHNYVKLGTVKRHQTIDASSEEISEVNLTQLLIKCARALSENEVADFENLIQKARGAVSINGKPIQRLGAYLIEGLIARKEASGIIIYRSLRYRQPESKDLLTYMHTLYEICPYFKFGYMAANGAIAEAFRNEDRVHIIDFQIAQGSQWITLLQALAARSSGAPRVRITGIDQVSQYARGDNLETVRRTLASISTKYNIPIEFHALPIFASEVTREILDVRPGEALAVNFTLQLHHIPDESVDVNNPRDGLLRMVKSLSPKVTTLVEQESNTNTSPFFTRFVETMNYYSAMFESIDVTLPRNGKERINVEQHCLARDIVNIIACEEMERVERHELLGKWKSRFTMAGFQPHPLSSYVNSVIRSLMKGYSENYTLVEKDGAMLLGWKGRNLISSSAWH
ncbi:hypothetical protein GIB67_021165 [Kingdonia uniflora]|uniref:Uncharacterized protein n=1 Tax=Kingdonia uniflora TaxID=39325 RepID=A0A7J7N7B5_9MAGN|nr:hypothetical protein GIB67_021165 [Kingdonia uniflora]